VSHNNSASAYKQGQPYYKHNQSGKRRPVDRGRGFKRVSDDHVEVYDIDMAAWLHMNNVAIAKAFKIGKESVITFLDPVQEERIDELSIDWLNSEAAKFASCVRQIKKVCLATKNRRGR